MRTIISLKGKKRRNTTVITVFFAFLTIYCASLIFMYAWGFISSIKTNMDFRHNLFGLPQGFPWEWEWANYFYVATKVSVPATVNGLRQNVFLPFMFLNSIIYSVAGALINTFTTWLVGYILARFPHRFSKFIYSLNLILMIVPILGTLPSSLQIKKALGLYDNWWFVITSAISFTGMYLLVFYSFHKGVGKDFSEAAYIDGASNWTAAMRVTFPITSQMFFVVFLITFIARWNDYMTMIIWMPNYPTLAFGIYKYSTTTATQASFPPQQMAGSVILMLPILLLFLLFQDFMMANLRVGGVKG